MDLDEVKACLRALLSSTAWSCSLSTLLIDFKDLTGMDLPLFGCLHPVEFLRTLDDTVQLFGNYYNPEVALIESKKSAHIASLVNRQRNAAPGKRCVGKSKRLVIPETNSSVKENVCFPWVHQETKLPVEFMIPQISLRPNGSHSLPHSSYNNQISPIETVAGEKLNSFCNGRSNEVQGETQKSCYFEDSESGSNVDDSRNGCHLTESSSFVNDGIKDKFKKLIRKYPKGLWCWELPELFQKEYKFPLDYREYGYTCLIQMLSELPDVFRCVRPGNEDWLLFDASSAPSLEEKKIMHFQATGGINCKTTANVKKVLCKCFDDAPNTRIELDAIPDLYEEMFGTCLDFQSLGFRDLKSFLKTLEGNLFTLLDADGKTYLVPSSISWSEALPPITAENDIFLEIFPKDVVGPDEYLLELDLAQQVAVGHVVKVSVAEVWSPGLFYIQLNKFKYRLGLLMKNLQSFYNVHLNRYKMPDSTIRPRQVCVGLYTADSELPDEWHRAQIIKVINEKTVLVNFVDFGTEARVKKTHLRFLHRNFQSFPVQGFMAKLWGIAPVEGEAKWPMSSSRRFLELVRASSLEAEIVDIDFKRPYMSVILFDLSRASATSINKTLVIEKLAREKETLPSGLPKGEPENHSKEPADMSVQEGLKKTEPAVTDEFTDIADLGQTASVHFKMRSLKVQESPPVDSAKPVENLKYEFDEVPDLKRDEKGKEIEKKVNKPDGEKKPSKSVSPLPAKPPTPTGQPEGEPKPETTAGSNSELIFPVTKPKLVPPGLEQVKPNLLLDYNQIEFQLPASDLRRKINFLAMEFLTKNSSIRQVGINDPGLALKIATEMAEAFVSSAFWQSVSTSCLEVAPPLCPEVAPPPSSKVAPPPSPKVAPPPSPKVAPPPSSKVAPPPSSKIAPPPCPEVAPPPSSKVAPPPSSKVAPPPSSKIAPPPCPEVAPPPSPKVAPPPSSKVAPPPSSKVAPPPEKDKVGNKSSEEASKPTQKTETPAEETKSPQEEPSRSPGKSKKYKEYVREKEIGGKTLHLVIVDGQFYFCAEEIVRSFTVISNREVADRILHAKKNHIEYRVITKATDEEILSVLKSQLPNVKEKKKRTKKQKIYLIPAGKVVFFLRNLGCNTKPYENDFLEIQSEVKRD